jgi:nucleotide-binding universal stress UspA family protein
MFRRVLVAYDGSQGATRALHAAVRLAVEQDAELIVLAVAGHLPHYGATVSEFEVAYEIEAQTCRRLLKEAVAYAHEHGATVRTEIRPGQAAQQLVRAAIEHDADLIVLGHSGRPGVGGLMLGFTAERVSRSAPCPVLLVR